MTNKEEIEQAREIIAQYLDSDPDTSDSCHWRKKMTDEAPKLLAHIDAQTAKTSDAMQRQADLWRHIQELEAAMKAQSVAFVEANKQTAAEMRKLRDANPFRPGDAESISESIDFMLRELYHETDEAITVLRRLQAAAQQQEAEKRCP